MPIYQRTIAQTLEISAPHLSDLINGRKEIGKKAAKKMAKFTGRKWTDLFTMTPEKMKEVLFRSAEEHQNQTGIVDAA
jgi:plasmid maintenance system antidote protein VapI